MHSGRLPHALAILDLRSPSSDLHREPEASVLAVKTWTRPSELRPHRLFRCRRNSDGGRVVSLSVYLAHVSFRGGSPALKPTSRTHRYFSRSQRVYRVCLTSMPASRKSPLVLVKSSLQFPSFSAYDSSPRLDTERSDAGSEYGPEEEHNVSRTPGRTERLHT